ncbi:MAG: ATP-dependent Clp protease ATP-binding subunit, partial [Chloroflexi bacterium]|nr:ATP-dependent Clp protease ATP-binding subunit [Chloroflexota bacterium]
MLRPDRFTEKAQEALAASQQIIRERRHSQWDAEHVLLALLQQEEGLTQDLLRAMGVDSEALRHQVEAALDQSPKMAYESTQIYVTPRLANLFQNADAEARRLKDEYIGIEHLLIALTQERQGDVARLFKEFHITQERLYAALQEVRGGARVEDQR